MGCLQDSIEAIGRYWMPDDTFAVLKRMRGTDGFLDDFSIAYIECAFWSSMTQGGEPLDEAHDASDLAPGTLETMLRDCDRFLATDAVKAAVKSAKWNPSRAGHDFWLTRGGHGAGFWDGDCPEPHATALTEASKAFGECDLCVGDDGRIYA